jgi:hypothetical protein
MLTPFRCAALWLAIVSFLNGHVADAASGVPLPKFATYFGGSRDDASYAIAVDGDGNVS